MKTIIIFLAAFAWYSAAFAQDTVYQDKNNIHLPENHPAMNMSGTGGGPDQGGNQGWKGVLDSSDSYCLINAGGKMRLQLNGKQVIRTRIVLPNGVSVSRDGMVLAKGGKKTQMRPGDCIGADGTIHRQRADK